MNTVALLLLLVTWSRKLNLAQSATTNFSQRVCDDHFRDGQFIIGGIVNVYEYNDIPCSGNLTDRLSFVEAIAYTIDLVNSRQDLLPNIDLGFEIRTDCGNEDIALWAAMTLAGSMGKLEFATTCPHNQRQTDKKVIAIVGTDRSSTSVFAAKVGGVFAIPVVSYHATSDDLSDSAKFPFFFRTVPPDKYQTNLIVDILLHFNWKYVALFYSLDSYGIHGSRQILSLAEKVGICVPITMPVSSKASEIKEIANSLIEHELVTVIISFSVPEYLHSVLLAIKTFNISRKFTFIGSDGWNPAEDMFQHFVDVLAGGIYIEFFSQHSTGFEEHYTKLTRNNDHASQWYKRKLKQSSIIANCTECSKVSVLKPHWNTQQVINAVYAIAYALNASLQEANLTTNIIDGWTLRKNLYGVTVSTNEASVQLDDNGEVAGKYLLSSWQIVNGVYQVVSIGTWDSSKKHSPLEIHEGLVQWGTPDNKVPVSLCVEECKPGYVQVPLEKKCCWGCQRCNDFAIVVTDNSSAFCQDCQPTHWPNKNYTKCLPIEPTFPHMHDIVFVLSGTATGFGFFLIILTLMGLCHYSEHPLIKASSRQLCRINLLGLTLSCVSVFLSFLKPTLATCVLSDAVISLAFCVTFTPILLKVNRIWRIFSLELGNELRFANNKSTITIVSLFIAAQVSIFTVYDNIKFGY